MGYLSLLCLFTNLAEQRIWNFFEQYIMISLSLTKKKYNLLLRKYNLLLRNLLSLHNNGVNTESKLWNTHAYIYFEGNRHFREKELSKKLKITYIFCKESIQKASILRVANSSSIDETLCLKSMTSQTALMTFLFSKVIFRQSHTSLRSETKGFRSESGC